MKKKILVSIAVFVLFFVAGTILKAKAETQRTSGWLWGGSEDASIGGTMGVVDGNETGVYDISMAHTSKDANNIDYGVSMDDEGNMSGHAWSDSIGWISFNSGDVEGACQDSSNPSVAPKKSGNSLVGFARVVGIMNEKTHGNSGGWDGCISLHGGDYGVSVAGDGKLSGYGWNGETAPSSPSNKADGLGWIDFSKAKIPCMLTYKCQNIGDCAGSDCGSKEIPGTCVETNTCGGTATADPEKCGGSCESVKLNCGTCDTSGKWQETKPQQ